MFSQGTFHLVLTTLAGIVCSCLINNKAEMIPRALQASTECDFIYIMYFRAES